MVFGNNKPKRKSVSSKSSVGSGIPFERYKAMLLCFRFVGITVRKVFFRTHEALLNTYVPLL